MGQVQIDKATTNLDGGNGPGRQVINVKLQESAALRLCCDLANLSKHYRLTQKTKTGSVPKFGLPFHTFQSPGGRVSYYSQSRRQHEVGRRISCPDSANAGSIKRQGRENWRCRRSGDQSEGGLAINSDRDWFGNRKHSQRSPAPICRRRSAYLAWQLHGRISLLLIFLPSHRVDYAIRPKHQGTDSRAVLAPVV